MFEASVNELPLIINGSSDSLQGFGAGGIFRRVTGWW